MHLLPRGGDEEGCDTESSARMRGLSYKEISNINGNHDADAEHYSNYLPDPDYDSNAEPYAIDCRNARRA